MPDERLRSHTARALVTPEESNPCCSARDRIVNSRRQWRNTGGSKAVQVGFVERILDEAQHRNVDHHAVDLNSAESFRFRLAVGDSSDRMAAGRLLRKMRQAPMRHCRAISQRALCESGIRRVGAFAAGGSGALSPPRFREI